MKRADGHSSQPMFATIARDRSSVVTAERVSAPVIRRFAFGTSEPNVAVRSDCHAGHNVFRQAVSGGQNLKPFFLEPRETSIRSNPKRAFAVRRDGENP